VPFVDHTGIDWQQVRRSQYWMYQRFRYEYPGPVWNLHQRLMVVPTEHHGDQYLTGHKLRVTADAAIRSDIDRFGNSIYYVDLAHVDASVDFEVWISIERNRLGANELPTISREKAAIFLEPSPLTEPAENLREVARQIAESVNSDDSWQLAEQISEWVWQKMEYKSGVTNVATCAAEALRLGQGLCQDYSHIMLALCRLNGLPARYVSGHLLGEGGSHAWVEVLLPAPDSSDLVAVPFDPTNHCRAGLHHVTVAVGRDFRDVSPTSGYFTAPYSGKLITSKRAGLITVEYLDGEMKSIGDNEVLFFDDEKQIA
jgi:transglutaminase-like putative cysteine protease